MNALLFYLLTASILPAHTGLQFSSAGWWASALSFAVSLPVGGGGNSGRGKDDGYPSESNAGTDSDVEAVFDRVRAHEFHPIREGFTYDRTLEVQGVADLNDNDWIVRTLAVRDLVRTGPAAANRLVRALSDGNPHVRQIASMVAGILRTKEAAPGLEKALREDSDEVVRTQAAISLGQIGRPASLDVLEKARSSDPSRDVRHQAVLAAYALKNGYPATRELARAYAGLDEERFNRVETGQPAPDFELSDTEGHRWRLSDFRGERPVVLIWIFADWCPVCHGEFRELINLRREFEAEQIRVFTLECHDLFPARVMAGKELEPDYWFADEPFLSSYREKLWWPHLVDRAAGAGVEYGVQPMAFTVHSEWINRPSVFIIDKEGIVRFAYYGTFWGDRPPVDKVLEMTKSGRYEFVSPERLKA